ncbi:MAG: tRNA threonylcarbamoyladenosine dehydratase [Victivallaceae bacterium]|nr:tRNA threonylcarbamoyladenosine dehydratase [Victivallaceae bacterium]
MLEFTDIPRWLYRTALLVKPEKLQVIRQKRVLVVGVGGVGAYAAELICRAGIGRITVADGDYIEITNRNRQLPALVSTEGRSKVEVMAERLRDINPDAEIIPVHRFLRDELTDEVLAEGFDYVVDAIDALSPKVALIAKCLKLNYPLVSSMGSGGKLDPTQVRIADISQTRECPLARAIRKRLHRQNIRQGFKAVFSTETVPEHAVYAYEDADSGKCGSMVGTISYMPPVFGCCCASVVIRDLTRFRDS